ncbi:MAG: chorismate mutase [Candidatus Neomarinimicrobiota bacterium]|jgi:chorismate mutase
MNTKNKIDELRRKIDDYDDKILNLLVKRFEISHKIGSIKQNSNSEIQDFDREKDIINRLVKKFSMINQEHIKSIFNQIFNVSKLIQERKK